MELLLTTTNPHKLAEVRSVFDAEPAARGLTWLDFDEVRREYHDGITDPVEDQPTFEGNAVIKARHYAEQTDRICLADDSGIEVDALGGRPGVKSARYSGVRGPRTEVDPANNAKLLDKLAGVPVEKRTARFVCAMCLFVPGHRRDQLPAQAYDRLAQPGDDHAQIVVRGEVAGRILLPDEADNPRQPGAGRGTHGFGYDPLFVLPDDHPRHPGRTTAQLADAEKNQISHRGVAARRLLDAMREAGLLPDR
ncbi:MAG: non-canonical purine NTP pyrophosphatase [Planctomycetota bacterium]